MASMLKMHDQPAALDVTPAPFSLMKKLGKNQCTLLAATKCQVTRSSILNVYPCSYMQEALMMFSEKHPGSYFVQNVFRISEQTDTQKLTESLQTVWFRNDALRTRIFLDDDFQSIQAVLDEPLDVPILDKDLNTYLNEQASPGYGEALSRCVILTSARGRYFVISQHHAVFDGYSFDLILYDIKKHYSRKSLKPTETGQFSSFIQYTLQIQDSPAAAQHWRQVLSNLTDTRFLQARKPASKANQEHKTTVDLLASQNTSLAVLIEGAWGILLGRYTDSEDVSFGVVRSGRTAPINGIDTIMGPTITSIPRRLRPAKNLLVAEYITEVERSTREAMPWEQYGLQNIRKLHETARQACNFQTLVIVQHQPEDLGQISENDLDLQLLKQEGAWSDECLTLECQPQNKGKLSISLSYDNEAISVDEIRWISYYFCRLLSQLTLKPGHCIGDLDMAGPETIQQTLLWNEYSIPRTARRVEELFQERIVNWPTLIAIDAVDAMLTYQELDDLSSILATSLRNSGLRRGDMVPLCLEKSAVMIVAIVGVLKAGGAYVPLEIDHPIERMRFIVREVGARIVLCT